jgi:predicted nucleic acid-binding protein
MIVADAGPIIALARAGLLDILPALVNAVVLPPGVLTEITRASGKPGAAEVQAAPWISVEEVAAEAQELALPRRLGPGEREAIRLDHARGLVLLLDERRARREAECLGIRLTSTLALLAEAKALAQA